MIFSHCGLAKFFFVFSRLPMKKVSDIKNQLAQKSCFGSLKGIAFGCLAGICYGINPLGVLPLYAEGLSPETVLCYRFAFGAMLLGATIVACRKSFKVMLRDFWILGALGLLFFMSSLSFYASFKYMDAGLASTLLFIYPLEVTLMMCLFFKEKLTLKTVLSISISFFGMGLLYHGGGEGGSNINGFGFLLVFIASITNATPIVLLHQAKLKVGALKSSFYIVVFCFVFMFLYATLLGSGVPSIPATPSQWGWGLMLGFVPTFVSLVFMAKAVKLVGSTPTAITGALEPLTAVCVGVFVFGETMTLRLAVGITLILMSVVLIAIRRAPK